MGKLGRIRKFILKELIDAFILIVICAVPTYMFAGNQILKSFSIFLNSILYGFIIGWTIWKGNEIVGYWLGKKLSWDKEPSKTLFYQILAAVIYTAIDIMVANYLIYKYIFQADLLNDLHNFIYYATVQFGISMLVITIIFLKHFFLSWKRSVIQEERFKREALALQYETLKSYVNPHFLFNSLSVLSSLVEKDTAKSQKFIKQLSDIYRYVLEQKDKELVDLSTELDFAQSFIELHKIRHDDSLKVDVDFDDLSGYIMPLCMQILLENAFKHNIISEDEPLTVKVWRENDYIVVQNKIQQRNTIFSTGGIGLETIQKRYGILSVRPLLINNDNGYFTVRIPVIFDANL